MDCANCETNKRQFYCSACISDHLRDFHRQIKHFASDRDEQIVKAKKALETTATPARTRRANLASAQSRLEEIQSSLAKLRKDNERKRERLRMLREDIASRRQTLSAARLQFPPSTSSQNSEYTSLLSSFRTLSSTITQARQGLISELVEVFNVVQVGGRPPIGGKAGTKGEWTIGDLILPVPGDMRRYPPDHINSVLTHAIHFLGLLTFYLGIKLPFEVVWSSTQPPAPSATSPPTPSGKLGVGQPWIGATRGVGTEYGGWAVGWNNKHPLHLMSNPSTSPTTSQPTPSFNPEDSILLSPSATASANPNFPTALAMLLYNVSYLAFTQNVDIPLNQAGDVLSNLWSICCSSDLGKYSHATISPNPGSLLPPPTPPTFQLDFAQLLQATTVTPRAGIQGKRNPSVKKKDSPSTRVTRERIPEEEEGWDLVDDGFGFSV